MTPAITLVSSQALRAHLSDYLRRARQGERITITVHGRPVAVLGPYDPAGTLEDLACVLGEEPGAMAGGEG
jgi:prevent-host-death family protein